MKHILLIKGKAIDIGSPLIMGILNTTPDSFFKSSRIQEKDVLKSIESMILNGLDILDIGAISTRPGAKMISVDEEIDRILPILKLIKAHFNDLIISIDTFNKKTAQICIEQGADMINDISAGDDDPEMFDYIIKYQIPYIMMHKKGKIASMQQNPQYEHVVLEIIEYFKQKIAFLHKNGFYDILLDPGFGFGKTIDHNYQILKQLDLFQIFEKPILVGISRKSMIYKLLESDPDSALNGTTILNTIAVLKKAQILRVHDVKEAKEIIKLSKYFL